MVLGFLRDPTFHCAVILVGILVLIGCVASFFAAQPYPYQGPYYRSNNTPNGFFEAFVGAVDYERGVVSFVMCPSSGSDLHGDFGFDAGLQFPDDGWGWVTVAVYQRRIVYVELWQTVDFQEGDVIG